MSTAVLTPRPARDIFGSRAEASLVAGPMGSNPHGSSRAVGPQLEIDFSAVAANTLSFAAGTSATLMAVVKADGFGHGAEEVARTALAHGATWLGVTSIDEALGLRAAGISAPVLSWLNPVDANYAAALAEHVDLAVPSLAHLAGIAAAQRFQPLRRPARIHLHLDTGMARDGAQRSEWVELCRAARRAEQAGSVRVVGVMGHLGCADVLRDQCNLLGKRQFAWGVQSARANGLSPAHLHLAATAATLLDRSTHHTMVRVGAGLVGIDPTGTAGSRWAMRLTAPVVSVRQVRAGTGVGYHHSWIAPAETRLALIPLGYADGIPRTASPQAQVWLRGRRCQVVGRISMDQIVVDVGDDHVEPGEVATIFGPGDHGEPTVAQWARWSDTIPHEVMTGIGQRVRRIQWPALVSAGRQP